MYRKLRTLKLTYTHRIRKVFEKRSG